MSTLNADTIATRDGTQSLGTPFVLDGVFRAWSRYDMSGTPSINKSFNVSSLTDGGTGYGINNFTNAMSDDQYNVTTAIAPNGILVIGTSELTPTAFGLRSRTTGGANTDYPTNCAQISGDLA